MTHIDLTLPPGDIELEIEIEAIPAPKPESDEPAGDADA